MRLLRTLAAFLALALAACMPPDATRSPAENAAADQAAALAAQGHFDQAAEAWLALAGQSRAHADGYRLRAAEAWREGGELERAAPQLATIKRQALHGDEPQRLDLLRAELALAQHDAAGALRLLTRPGATIPPALAARALELTAQALAASGDTWGAARTRVQMDTRLAGLDRAQNRQQALALLDQVGVPALQQRIAAMQPGDAMFDWVNEVLRQHGLAVARPLPELAQPVGTLVPGADANVREGYAVPAKIALLLPAGASYAVASGAIREGFLSAYIDAGRNRAPRPALRIYDSTGGADGATQAYQQAVADGAQLVVGPLTRTEVAAVFGQASLPVPLLALNHPDDRKLPTGEVSEFALMPEAEGAQAADHMIEQGRRQAWIILSTDDFAQRAGAAFKAEFLARGGEVAGAVTLPPATTSYASLIAGLHLPTGQAPLVTSVADTPEDALPDAPPPPAPEADTGAPGAGIFISMLARDARLLLPQLRLARIGLPVTATSHIWDGTSDVIANRDLDGVEFCDAPWLFDAQPGLPERAAIAAALPAARGGSARLFAFGMDAWNLVPYLKWLRGHPGSYVPGASGQLTMDAFGRVRRVLSWARFDQGQAHLAGGTLELDDAPAIAPPAAWPAAAGDAADGND